MSEPHVRQPVTTTIAPNLVVASGVDAIQFYGAAFGAVVLHRVGDDAGVAQLSVGGARFWIAAGESADLGRFLPTSLPGRSVSMIRPPLGERPARRRVATRTVDGCARVGEAGRR